MSSSDLGIPGIIWKCSLNKINQRHYFYRDVLWRGVWSQNQTVTSTIPESKPRWMIFGGDIRRIFLSRLRLNRFSRSNCTIYLAWMRVSLKLWSSRLAVKTFAFCQWHAVSSLLRALDHRGWIVVSSPTETFVLDLGLKWYQNSRAKIG